MMFKLLFLSSVVLAISAEVLTKSSAECAMAGVELNDCEMAFESEFFHGYINCDMIIHR